MNVSRPIIHVSPLSRENTALRARRECAHFHCARSPRLAAMPLGGGSCSRRTNHPLVASGSEEPSHKIELVFSASAETVEPQESELRRSIGRRRDLAACTPCDLDFPFVAVFYAAAPLNSGAGTKSRCSRSTASRYVRIFRATASVARLAFPFCFSLA